MKPTYLQSVLDKIENKNARAEIGEELESHLLDKRDYYMELGYSEDEATRRAEEEMGDPDDCAVPLNGLHSSNRIGWIAVAIVILISFLIFSAIRLDLFYYSFVDPPNTILGTVHYIEADFISFLAVTLLSVLLLHNRRRNSMGIPVFVIIYLFLQFIYAVLFGQFPFAAPLLQPFFYAAVTIADKGFSGYINSIFSYEEIPVHKTYMWCSAALTVFLIAWAVFQLVIVKRDGQQKNNRIHRFILKAVNRVVCGLLAVNFVVMSVCTGIAAFNVQDTLNRNRNNWKEMVDYTVSVRLDQPKEAVVAPLRTLFENETYIDPDALIFSNDYAHFSASWSGRSYYYDAPLLVVDVSGHDLNIMKWFGVNDNINSYNRISPIEAVQLYDLENNMPLEDFMNSGLYYKSCAVTHQYGMYDMMLRYNRSPEPFAGGESICFEYDITDGDRYYVCFYSPAQNTGRSFTLYETYRIKFY